MNHLNRIMTEEQKKTFQNLQKPTMSLIASFYQMTPEIQGVFSAMMAIYESHPTEETAKVLSDKIMGKEGIEDKKKWLEHEVSSLSPIYRVSAKKKYIDEQQSVPKGVPTSGMLLVGLGIVSKAEKDALMEAQAATRLISHVDVMHDFESKTSYQNADGTFENAFLDKPFATKMQRLEHLACAVVNDMYTQNEASETTNKASSDTRSVFASAMMKTKNDCDKNLFLQKARHEALKTLRDVSSKMKEKNPKIAEAILGMTNALATPAQEKSQLHSASEMLTKEDYDTLKEQVKGRPVEGLVTHRIEQILSMDAANLVRLKRAQGGRNG